MRLLRVGTRGFRNLAADVIDVAAPMIVFYGPNGQGKTNYLEAIGVLGAVRSFRTAKPAEMVAFGETSATVEGLAESEEMTRKFRYSLGEGGRSLRREERTIDALAWLASLRAAWFVPADTAPIRGEPALRRAMLDRATLTIAPAYLMPARDLKRVLEQKAAVLRSPRPELGALDALDEQLAPIAAAVTRARAEVVARIAPRFGELYRSFAGDEGAEVAYRPFLEADAAGWLDRLRMMRAAELGARRALAGPHRDDVTFSLLGHAARSTASQGQARSLVLAWKLAELHAARDGGETPLFLVDDVGSELDPARTERLVALLGTLGAQIFLTTTDRRFVPDGVVAGRYFRVEAGVARPG